MDWQVLAMSAPQVVPIFEGAVSCRSGCAWSEERAYIIDIGNVEAFAGAARLCAGIILALAARAGAGELNSWNSWERDNHSLLRTYFICSNHGWLSTHTQNTSRLYSYPTGSPEACNPATAVSPACGMGDDAK